MMRWRLMVAAAAVAVTLSMPQSARAEEYPGSAGWGILAVFANIGYMPVKTVYAALGGLTGSLAYVCTGGSYDTASYIWAMSLGGTYVLTPSMIRGEDPIAFAGGATTVASSDDDRGMADMPAPDARTQGGRREEQLPAS